MMYGDMVPTLSWQTQRLIDGWLRRDGLEVLTPFEDALRVTADDSVRVGS